MHEASLAICSFLGYHTIKIDQMSDYFVLFAEECNSCGISAVESKFTFDSHKCHRFVNKSCNQVCDCVK